MRLSKLFGSILLATASATAPASPAGAAMAQPADIAAAVDAMVRAAYPANGPGAAVIVTRGGRLVYSGGRGLADIEAGRPITPDTAFKLGSIVKQFTAAIVLQLAAEGKLTLDDPVSRFLPDFPKPGADATVRQLLNHSSGIQDITKIPGFMGSPPTLRENKTADLVAAIASRPSPATPGTKWEYNNSGYILLGAIVEKVTGKAWHEVAAERIARPLGLASLAYAAADEANPARARGYSLLDGRQQPSRGVHMSVAHAAGGLVASANDLAKWSHALHQGKVVPPELYREMTQPVRLADGSSRPYGFGFRLQQLRGRKALVHGGAGRGINTDGIYIPSEDLFVAVLANSDDSATDPSTLTRRIGAMAMGEPMPAFSRADVPMSYIEPLFGAYRGEEGPPFNFFSRDGKLYLARGDSELEAFAAGGDRFFFGPERLVWVTFVRESAGSHVLEVHDLSAARPERLVRTGAVPPPLVIAPEILQSYTGTYQTETVAMNVALGADGRLTIAGGGQGPYMMRPTSPTEFRVDAANFRVAFFPENGVVDRMTLYRGARELHGTRTGR